MVFRYSQKVEWIQNNEIIDWNQSGKTFDKNCYASIDKIIEWNIFNFNLSQYC